MTPEIKTIFGCPFCGFRVSGTERACPRCGREFSEGIAFECPFCGSSVKPTDDSCPACEVQFHTMAAQVSERLLDKAVTQIVDELDTLAEIEKMGPRCPVCSEPLRAPGAACARCEERRIARLEAKGRPLEEYLDAEIFGDEGLPPEREPQRKTPRPEQIAADGDEEVALCPVCDNAVTLSDLKCPHCGAEFEEEEDEETLAEPMPETHSQEELELASCPVCGALAGLTVSACPSCGAEFEDEEEESPEVPPVAPPVRAKIVVKPKIVTKWKGRATAPSRATPREPRGLSNGIGAVNGRGRTNGRGRVNGVSYTNGSGAINGSGRINGQGRVNGAGAVNGRALVNGTGALNGGGAGVRRPGGAAGRSRLLLRWRFLVLLVALVIILAAFAYMAGVIEKPPYDVDGDGGDWSDAVMFGMASVSDSPSTNVVEWSVDAHRNELYLYVGTEGAIMAADEVESFYLFIDSDDSPSTGYEIMGIGADFMVELQGWNGSVMQSAVWSYHSQDDHLDWSGWVYASAAVAAVDDRGLEAMVGLFFEVKDDSRFILVSKDQLMRGCCSYPVLLKGGLLIVDAEASPDVSTDGLLAIDENAPLMRLTFACEGEGGTVDSIAPELVGVTSAGPFQQFAIEPGQERVVDLAVDSSTLTAGQFVSVTIDDEDISSSFSRIHIVDACVRAYAGAAPSSISIDGAFADWEGITVTDFDPLPIDNPNIDIDEVGAANGTSDSFFYVSVVGEMCSGDYVPKIGSKPSGTGGGTVVPSRKTAEDFMRVYIDSDQSAATGSVISKDGTPIGADYLIEVSGICCEVESTRVLMYHTNDWVEIGAPVEAAIDLSRMEIGIPSASIDATDGPIDFLIVSTDWRGNEDVASNETSALSTKYWVVASSSTEGTSMSYQRKMFYDGVNFWSFHYSGSNTVYVYSADGGESWTSGGQVFSTTGVADASLWYDPGTHQVYVVGDRATQSANVYIRQGSVNPGAHTITWASEQTLSVSSVNLGGKNTFISKDTSGYLWILSSQQTQQSPARYNLAAYKSTSTNATSAWGLSGTMLASVSNNADLKGSILPTGSGSDVFAVYNYDSTVEARKCTSGSWGSAENVYTDTGSLAFINMAPASAVVDGNGGLHVVFGDANKDGASDKPHIQYRFRHATNGWASAITIDGDADTVNHRYPTISLDTSTGNVYAFWIKLSDNSVVCKKNASGSWSFVTLPGQTSDEKQYLTSVYSASEESLICWQWTQNTTGTVEVNFDKIPEFGDVVVPMFVIIGVFFVASRRKRKRDLSTPDGND